MQTLSRLQLLPDKHGERETRGSGRGRCDERRRDGEMERKRRTEEKRGRREKRRRRGDGEETETEKRRERGEGECRERRQRGVYVCDSMPHLILAFSHQQRLLGMDPLDTHIHDGGCRSLHYTLGGVAVLFASSPHGGDRQVNHVDPVADISHYGGVPSLCTNQLPQQTLSCCCEHSTNAVNTASA